MSRYIVSLVLLIAMMLPGFPAQDSDDDSSLDYDYDVECPVYMAWHPCGHYCEENCSSAHLFDMGCSQQDCIDNPDIEAACRCQYGFVKHAVIPGWCMRPTECEKYE